MAVRSLRDLLHRSEPEPTPVDAEPARERCLSCNADLGGSRSFERYRVCHSCGFHFHLSAAERLASLLDPGSFHESDRGVTSIDPLSFGKQSYRSRVITAQRRTGLAEAAVTGRGQIVGREVVVAFLDFAFLGGSIGVVAGERLARAFEQAAARRLPVVSVCSTSGTRMQEGLLALMQAPRVVAAARRHGRLGLPHIAVLADPTTGSAYSGFVNLADVILAEPNALVGYAALRALQEQEGRDLPPGAHTSESHLRLGLIDAVVGRPQLRDTVALILDLLVSDFRLSTPEHQRAGKLTHTPHSAWQQLQLSRHQQRPTSADFVARMTSSFIPLRGDRSGSDDPAVTAGLASLGGEAVMIVAQERSHAAGGPDGWIRPGGFRKADRVIALAGKFGLPVITLIDTAGAHPGIESEEAGLGHAVASCMARLLEVPSPTIAAIVGEGNSEAAAAFAVADRVLMLDNAVYEVLRPEDAARILYREAGLASEAAERLRITSHDCLRLGIADATVPEPADGAHTNHEEAALLLRRSIMRELAGLRRQSEKRRLNRRYERYRQIGSTRSWVRGTLERRYAHLVDRITGILSRLGRRSSREPFGDYPDIPI
jgi:acetyl-CoA carboxylase carboxyl transferase subunit beta